MQQWDITGTLVNYVVQITGYTSTFATETQDGPTTRHSRTVGHKYYELSNHLGNPDSTNLPTGHRDEARPRHHLGPQAGQHRRRQRLALCDHGLCGRGAACTGLLSLWHGDAGEIV